MNLHYKLSKSYIAHFYAYNFLEHYDPNLILVDVEFTLFYIYIPFVIEPSICLNNSLAWLLLISLFLSPTHIC